MPATHFIDDQALSTEELASRIGDVDTSTPHAVPSAPGNDGLVLETVAPLASPEQGEPFQPIGIGQPLSIRLHAIYVGDLPRRRQDVMLVSGLKAEQTFERAARVVNLIHQRTRDNSYLEFSAFRSGSPVVYYTPALTNSAMSCSFELVPDTFNSDLVDKVGGLFQMAGGLPIFAPAASYLMAGSFLTRIFSSLGKAFLEKGPTLAETLSLNFGIGGLPSFRAGLYAVYNQNHADAFSGLKPRVIGGSHLRLVDAENKPYAGRAPYLLIGVNGKKETQLENLTQQVATAAMLEEFYPSESSSGVVINQLSEAFNLYNDLKFLRKAQALAKEIPDATGDELAELQKLYDAYRNNIKQEPFLNALPDLG